MAYLNSTNVNGPAEVIAALATFVAANGWAVVSNTLVGSNRTLTIRIAGVTDYLHIYNTDTASIGTRCSIGYTAGAAPESQPNVSPSTSSDVTGPYPNVYFFADSNEVWVTIQVAGAIEFRHLALGMINKAGNYTGGTYHEGSFRGPTNLGDLRGSIAHTPFVGGGRSNLSVVSSSSPYYGSIRLDVPADSVSNGFYSFGDDLSPNTRAVWTGIGTWTYGPGSLSYILGGTDANGFDGRSILHPINVFAMRTGADAYWSPIGNVRNTRVCNMTKFSPAQELAIGNETWVLFPAFKRSLASSDNYDAPNLGSHTLGYAIKKVT